MPGDGVVTGFGRMDGRTVGLHRHRRDRTGRHDRAGQHAQAGPDDRAGAAVRLPAGAAVRRRRRAHSRRHGLAFQRPAAGFPDLPAARARASRRVPRAAAVLGPSYGDSALHASTAHFVVMVASAAVALSGPSVVEAAIGEQLTDAELGGPDGALATGNAHMVVEDRGGRVRGDRRVPVLPAVRRGQPRARGPSGRARGRPGRPGVGSCPPPGAPPTTCAGSWRRSRTGTRSSDGPHAGVRA